MKFASVVRQHLAALRALIVLTGIVGIGYPMFVWLLAQTPGLKDNAEGSLIDVKGRSVASRLIGQSFADANGSPLPQYFQSRPSAAGDGYDPMSSGASNLGPESIIDSAGKQSLLTQVCARSKSIGELHGVDGSRPFCTDGGVGAVLSVIGPREASGEVVNPTKVISVNEPCASVAQPFLASYRGVRVECAEAGADYAIGQIVPVYGSAAAPLVPADAVTASGSGLDPHISPAYAELQVNSVARTRGVAADAIHQLVLAHTDGRDLGVFGEPRVNVVELNVALDRQYPAES